MKFQIERIALFSDAVFAIAITLMIIEVKPPHLGENVSFSEAAVALLRMAPIFIGLILSFFLIGVFWMRHHQVMKYLKGYNYKLLWLNLTFLFLIAIIPFSTSFVFENLLALTSLPLIIYNLNYIAATIVCYLIFHHVLNPANNIRVDNIEDDIPLLKREILFPIYVYVFVIILAFVDTRFASMGYAAFAFEKYFVKRRSKNPKPVEIENENSGSV